MKIGIIGLGAVGGTIYHALKFYHEKVLGFDKLKKCKSFDEVLKAEVIFIALPTNSKKGRLDCSLISNMLKKLERRKYNGVVVIKSTLSMDFVSEIENSPLRVVVMPEFLHERSSLQDFVRPKVVVIAGNKLDVDFVINKVFYWLEEKIPIFYVDYKTAIMTKLVMNAFAATKISFVNEVKRICSDFDVDPKIVMKVVVCEGRMAPEYSDPTKGPFGGKCLPKDLMELIKCSNKSILLKAVMKVNEVIKKERED